MQRPTEWRDLAAIIALLDTGIRASALCALRIGDVDLRSMWAEVMYGRRSCSGLCICTPGSTRFYRFDPTIQQGGGRFSGRYS
jgi:integrase